MIDLTKCSLRPFRMDESFILYRAQPSDADPVLILVPREATYHTLEKLENEYLLAADLDPDWAVLPIELVPSRENMMLVLGDSGGELLSGIMDGKAAGPSHAA